MATFSGNRIITRCQKVLPSGYRAKILPEVRPLGRGHLWISLGKRVARHRISGVFVPAAPEFLKLSLPKSFVARLRPERRPTTKSTMKATNVQLPVRLTKRILFLGAGPPRAAGHAKLLIECRGRRSWYTFFRSLRAVLSGVLDSSPYDQISLGREVSVAFTSQGPAIYRYGRNSAADSVSATRETNPGARVPDQS